MGGGSGALPGDNPGTEMRQAGAVMTPCGVTWARQNGERICLPRRNAGRRRGGCGLGKPPNVWRADQLLCLRDLHHILSCGGRWGAGCVGCGHVPSVEIRRREAPCGGQTPTTLRAPRVVLSSAPRRAVPAALSVACAGSV